MGDDQAGLDTMAIELIGRNHLGPFHRIGDASEGQHFAQQNMPMLCPEPAKGAGNFLSSFLYNFLSPAVTRRVVVECVQPFQ
jgi:hypothetical protein